MPKTISLTTRQSMYAATSGDVIVYLLTISHEEITDGPIRLSTDPTQMLEREPLRFGTLSNGDEYEFVAMGVSAPDEEDGVPTSTTFILHTINRDLIAAVRSTQRRAAVELAIVSARAPDFVEEHLTGLKVVASRYNENTLSVDVSREDFTAEAFPYHRMTRAKRPGLFP